MKEKPHKMSNYHLDQEREIILKYDPIHQSTVSTASSLVKIIHEVRTPAKSKINLTMCIFNGLSRILLHIFYLKSYN